MIIKTDKFKTVTCAVLLSSPLTKENSTKNAMLCQLLKRGSKNYPTYGSYVKKTEELFGAVFDISNVKKGEQQIMSFIIDVIKNADGRNLFAEAMEFVYDIIQNPLITEEAFNTNYFDASKTTLEMIIKGKQNDKKRYALERCIELSFKDEAFGVSGDGYIEDIGKMDPKMLYKHYKHILETASIKTIAVGDIDSIQSPLKSNTQIIIPSIMKHKEEQTIIEDSEMSQGKLCISASTAIEQSGKSFLSLLVANAILGGTPSSRLFMNVREKENLCYYIDSAVYRFKSAIIIQAGIDSMHFEKTVSIIRNEIKNVADKSFSAEELANVKMYLSKQFTSIKDNPNALLDYSMTSHMLGDSNTIDETIDLINSVSAEEAAEAFKNVNIETVYFLR